MIHALKALVAAPLALVTALALCSLVGCKAEGPQPPPETSLTVQDLEGNPIDPFAGGDAMATVFLFTRTDCPISNRYAPEVRRLHETFEPQGIRFILIYPDPNQPVDEIRHHLEEFGYPCPAWRDPEHQLVEFCGARITPEAAVFRSSGDLAYLGRIDDRYVDFGQARAEPNSRDLEAALLAIVNNRPIVTPRTEAVGCYIADLK